MVEKSVKRETHDQALVRLAKQARDRGVQLFRVITSGEMFASSSSQPGMLHRVTTISCDCPGFIRHQRCMHYAALLDSLDWLPVVEPATRACIACGGSGELWSDGGWSPDRCGCCSGRGHVDVVADRVPTNVIDFPVTDDRRPAA